MVPQLRRFVFVFTLLCTVAGMFAIRVAANQRGIIGRPEKVASAVTWRRSGAADLQRVRRASFIARHSTCDAKRGPAAYPWPIKPFWKQHPVRGDLGDPRTIFLLGDPGDRSVSGGFHFHNGVDIVAAPGTAVFPVVSGVAHTDRLHAYGDEVVVRTRDRRTFQYFHLIRVVHEGQRVWARRTVLGYVLGRAGHVHLSEIDRGRTGNPLEPGHLSPYRDATAPVVRAVSFRDTDGRLLSPRGLKGDVEIVADAFDRPALPLPGRWRNMVVTPALVGWELTSLSGFIVIPPRVAVDFRRTLPPNKRFWDVFASGTFQNSPAIDGRYFGNEPGRYLFDLTQVPLDTRALGAGEYLLTVTAVDVCGNSGSLSERVSIVTQPGQPGFLGGVTRPSTEKDGLISWPARRNGYTIVLRSLQSMRGRAAAVLQARRAAAAGLPLVGVLASSRFLNLRPGYYVVFTGVYATARQALAAATLLPPRYANAYVRQVMPRPSAYESPSKHASRGSRTRSAKVPNG